MTAPYPQYPVVILGFLFLTFGAPSSSYAFLWNNIEVTPRVALSETYDDNITFIKNNPVSDAVTCALIGLGFKIEGKTHSLALDANVAHEFFSQNTSFNNTAEDVTLRLQKELSKYDLIKITDSFSHSEEPRSFEDAFGRTSGRYFTYCNVFNTGYHRDLNQQLAWDFRYANDLTDFSQKDLSDSAMNTVGTSLEYAFDSANILGLNYAWNKRDFSPGPAATEQEVSLNLRHFFTTQLYLDVQPGANFVSSYNDKDYTKPMVRVFLTNDIDKNTQAGISFEKKYTTTAYTQDLFNIWRVSMTYLKQLTNRSSAAFNAFYGHGDYVITDILEKYQGVAIGCMYDLTKKAKLNLSYAFSQNSSTAETDSYTKNTFFLGVTFEF